MGLCQWWVARAASLRHPSLFCSSAALQPCSAAALQLRSSASVLSLAWLVSMHLMVYSFHSGAGCCAMRILSHSIYLPSTIFAAWALELVCSHVKFGANSQFQSRAKTANILRCSPWRQMFCSSMVWSISAFWSSLASTSHYFVLSFFLPFKRLEKHFSDTCLYIKENAIPQTAYARIV